MSHNVTFTDIHIHKQFTGERQIQDGECYLSTFFVTFERKSGRTAVISNTQQTADVIIYQ